ncbi:hypothetical protein HYH96_18340 [Clostridium botulinum]|uniref:Uncharacterized protein n=3 Tax=Clostridium TaxID=1485 RepID=A0A6M0Y1L7_CLOSG|nr:MULTISPECIES: hypothetical protein [Clostridium]AJD29322.1 hypothetical protein T258_3989 [Clostridium botulinum Prevot_594]ACA47064.1 hypothetical protein CLD_A0005 [Clostridium botulinum B1 str. Okra]ACA57517.1 hypothetical protein CLK_A0150 [Clostridium botulinum A3 str. Loch Maree]AJE13418.1 hypothetical protein T259_4179 [Clostridium botulinum CDC_1436]APQ78755.1 hypothetical protein RSJ10_3705 [Clostridium botulinum]
MNLNKQITKHLIEMDYNNINNFKKDIIGNKEIDIIKKIDIISTLNAAIAVINESKGINNIDNDNLINIKDDFKFAFI